MARATVLSGDPVVHNESGAQGVLRRSKHRRTTKAVVYGNKVQSGERPSEQLQSHLNFSDWCMA